MKILSLDTAGDGCALALLDGETLRAGRIEAMTRGQDARLVPMIEALLSDAGIGFEALDRIAVATGPGSFTGLRVGLATAHGLSLATGLPVVGIDCFALAQAALALPPSRLLVAIESKREDLYAACIEDGKAGAAFMDAPARLAAMAIAEDLHLTGDAAWRLAACDPRLAERLCAPATVNRAHVAARLAATADLPEPGALPQPFYLREPDVTTPKQR